MKRLLSGVLLILVAAGCDALISPSHYATVHVEVVSTKGEPADGVDLTLYTGLRPVAYGRTDARGTMRFERVPEGRAYGVSAARSARWEHTERLIGGPATHVAQFALLRDSVRFVRLTMVRRDPGTIEAVVRDPQGLALEGVLVTLYTPSRLVSVLPTDADGFVRFEDVPLGRYGVSAERPAAYREVFAEERIYSEELRLVTDGDTLRTSLAFSDSVSGSR